MKGIILIPSFALFCLVGCGSETTPKPVDPIHHKGGFFEGIASHTIIDSMIVWVEMRNDVFHTTFLNKGGWLYIPNTHMNTVRGSSKPDESILNYAGGGWNQETDDADFWITRLKTEDSHIVVGLDSYQPHSKLFEEIHKVVELKGKKINDFISSEKSECERWR